ncbi:PepSY domain-containing protein [Streptomyces sp. NBC_00201]|uniref:PepSY-associated TM helix domain-containing protein n=1 Tax=unclassified Streptomyces TaxID=2593676 RepID=UPI0022513898|nr:MULTISPECIES: PepSY-associated TM helix domain-containing protein [unclassified Streptomyces]MCX5250622.1 PepSY domain-containing protein [Streptomyces sp. NBC_00201]MCX5291449.1 PepSY domain-containing protein [Streptomyces sp. NBC_00183]
MTTVDSEEPALPEPADAGAEATATTTAVTPTTAAPVRKPEGLGPLLARLHFYAGILVAPFLLVAAVTGLLYTFTPQLDSLVYGKELHVSHTGSGTVPLSEQVAAARAEHPKGTLIAVRPGSGDDTAQVDFALPELGEKTHTVYVDPYTGKAKGQLTTWYAESPLTTWLDALHRNLNLGTVGRYYSETAASWLWVLVLGGLVLWWRRRHGQRTARRLLLPDRAAKKGVRRTRSWHAVTGVWLSIGLLGLSATGLTWSRYAGANFTEAVDALHSHTPSVTTSLTTGTASSGAAKSVDPAAIDGVLKAARADGVDGPVSIAVPADGSTAWTVTQTRNLWPVGRDSVAVDAATDRVTDRIAFADWPVMAKLTRWGINAHMGTLFGLANQILLALLAIGLICVIVWGYRMWWQRRPTRSDRRAALGAPPARGAWRALPSWSVAVGIVGVAVVGWIIPLFGIPLVAFLAIDLAVGAVRNRRTAGSATVG